MEQSLLNRHLRLYLHRGFAAAVVAAVLNGTYWRLPITGEVRGVLQALTLLAGFATVVLNAVMLRPTMRQGATARRITWLLIATGLIVIATVVADVAGLREVWALS